MREDVAGPLLTLEPLIEAVRDGVQGAGWALSGLQKTTSHEFAGRWEGESTRSAYLFFHRPPYDESISIEGYLDETSRGLQGNLTLVIDARPLGEVGEVTEAFRLLGAAVTHEMRTHHALSVSLRARLAEPDADPGSADVELRFRLRIPPAAIRRGATAVVRLIAAAVPAFEALAAHPEVRRVTPHV